MSTTGVKVVLRPVPASHDMIFITDAPAWLDLDTTSTLAQNGRVRRVSIKSDDLRTQLGVYASTNLFYVCKNEDDWDADVRTQVPRYARVYV